MTHVSEETGQQDAGCAEGKGARKKVGGTLSIRHHHSNGEDITGRGEHGSPHRVAEIESYRGIENGQIVEDVVFAVNPAGRVDQTGDQADVNYGKHDCQVLGRRAHQRQEGSGENIGGSRQKDPFQGI
ncbi:MAG: hypothetical protein GTN69_09845 [Armatimonadetes bacterium]|nr:hypothetical protein [Armatimonadota bacterium]NIO76159.1 hypothetical protein [Armatimonadota bacterium]NIO98855.1 hypothetical protein [Armatimonadota bacterium]